MLPTNEYRRWNKVNADTLRNISLSENTMVWYSGLCPDGTDHPTNCSHRVAISILEFKKYHNSYKGVCYMSQDEEKKVAIINYRSAILTLLGSALGLIIVLIQCTNEVVHSQGMEIHQVCDCSTEDIVVGKGSERVRFKVVYLSQEQRWKYASNSELTNGYGIENFLKTYLPRVPNFDPSIGIVAVGLASQEGQLNEEEFRANSRADAILSYLRVVDFSKYKELYKLNLGQYLEKLNLSKEETAYQRRVIVIGIMEKNKNMLTEEIGVKLKVALQDSEGLNFKSDRYSKFEFGKY